MVATNTVKINGVLYKAGDNLPGLNAVNNEVKTEEKAVEENIEVEEKVVNKAGRPRKK